MATSVNEGSISVTIEIPECIEWIPMQDDIYFTPNLHEAQGNPRSVEWKNSHDDFFLLLGRRVHKSRDAAIEQQEALKKALLFILS